MGTAASAEPCVCERLWESITVLRESGHRYGMSERDIERFITQVLQTNEPQTPTGALDQNGFPLVRAAAKCVLVLFLLLVLALGLSLPQSQSKAPSLGFSWSGPLGAARLLDLPIAHKYNLQGDISTCRIGSGRSSSVNMSICTKEAGSTVLQSSVFSDQTRLTLSLPLCP